MTYFMKLREILIIIIIIDVIDHRADIAMQKQPYLKAYKEQTICEVCVYDFEIKEICRNTQCIFMELGSKLTMMTLLRHLKIKLSKSKTIYVQRRKQSHRIRLRAHKTVYEHLHHLQEYPWNHFHQPQKDHLHPNL